MTLPKCLERKGRERVQLKNSKRKRKKKQKKEEIFIPELSYPDPLQEEDKEIERLLTEEDDDVVDTSEIPSIEPNINPRLPGSTLTNGNDFIPVWAGKELYISTPPYCGGGSDDYPKLEIFVGIRGHRSRGCKKPAEVSVVLTTTLSQFGKFPTESS